MIAPPFDVGDGYPPEPAALNGGNNVSMAKGFDETLTL